MADQSIIEQISRHIDEALADQNGSLPSVLNAGNVEAALANLKQAATDLANSGDLGEWVGNANNWQQSLRDLATAYAPAGSRALDQLLVRVLQARFPRTAAILSVLDIIRVDDPEAGTFLVDWDRFKDFITDPETAINEALWDALLDDLNIPLSGHLPAVLAALIILAPRTIIALKNDQLKLAGLPQRTSRSNNWTNFLAASQDWYHITIPFGDPTAATPAPAGIMDWKSGLDPDMSLSFAFRSDRVDLGGGNRQTDMEFWTAFGLEQNEWVYQIGGPWMLRIKPGLSFGFGRVEGGWHGAFRAFNTDPSLLPSPSEPVELTISPERPDGAPDFLFGPPYDSRIVIKDVLFFLKVREESPIVEVGVKVENAALIVSSRWFRTFGHKKVVDRAVGRSQDGKFAVEGIKFDLSLVLGYVESQGLLFNLASQFDINMIWEKRLGNKDWNITLHGIRISVPIEVLSGLFFRIRADIRLHFSVQLSSFLLIVVDGAGVWGGYWRKHESEAEDSVFYLENDGEYCPYFGLIPPSGAGLQIKAGPVIGGGYIERYGSIGGLVDFAEPLAPGEGYGGVLYLKIYDISVVAFGLFEKIGNRPSFVAVIGVTFKPGIQLGYGFAITGIGGLVAIHRRMDTDALRERLTSGTAGRLLFPQDPIKDAPTILGDLRAIFPVAENVYVGGLMIQITWLGFARFDLGLAIEFPGPSKIVLLGVFRAEIAPEPKKPILQLRVDIVGILDFEKKRIEFDATIINSKLIDIFQLTGDVAFRLSYGDNPYVMMSFGGFHPDFNPEPVIFPEMARLAITQNPITFLGIPIGAGLRVEGYLAVTSNSFQIGGKIEATLDKNPLYAIGYISLDILIQFKPFYFDVHFVAGFRVKFKFIKLLGVRIEGRLQGPGPFRISGKFCIEMLFFDICWKGSFTIGDERGDSVTPIPSLVAVLTPALTSRENLSSVRTGDDYVNYELSDPDSNAILIPPQGKLVWSQKEVPLDLLVDRFHATPLAQAQAVIVETAAASTPAQDWFAAGSFQNLSASEALNKRSFERLQSGIELGFGEGASDITLHEVEVQTVRLPQKITVTLVAIFFPAVLMEAVDNRSAPNTALQPPPKVSVKQEQWQQMNPANGVLQNSSLTESDAHQRAKFFGGVAVPENDLIEFEAV